MQKSTSLFISASRTCCIGNYKCFSISFNGCAAEKHEEVVIDSSPPGKIKADWIGPPDKYSNLRPIVHHIPHNESQAEKEFRLKREEFFQFNHDFWAKHNKNFVQQKSAFIKESETYSEAKSSRLSADQMSEFYKKFLDENREMHLNYNKELYKKNIALLWPAFKVKMEKLWKKPRIINANS